MSAPTFEAAGRRATGARPSGPTPAPRPGADAQLAKMLAVGLLTYTALRWLTTLLVSALS